MSTLVRLLLRMFGCLRAERPYLTPVAKTIDSLGGSKHSRWLWGAWIHFLPVILGLAAIFLFRRSEITHGWKEIMALCLASTWAGVGPACLWYYERYTLPILNRHCRLHMADARQRRRVKRVIFTSPIRSQTSRLFVYVGVGIVVAAFVSSIDFIRGFGIRGYRDPLWLVLLGGAASLGFYAALGCCLAYKAVELVDVVAEADVTPDLYHEDQVMGFSFIGEFALRTMLMFASGWLFVPLLLMMAQHSNLPWLDNRLLLIAAYALFLGFVFFRPVIIIHRTIVRMKRQMIQRFGAKASTTLQTLAVAYTAPAATEFDFLRNVVADTKEVRDWPLSMDARLEFALSTVLFPIIVGLVVVWLE